MRRTTSNPATEPGRDDDATDARIPAGGIGQLTFVGTATVVLRLGAFTVLTDPNFLHRGDRAKLGGGLRSRRLTDPALEIADLPELDLVVLSHHHGDHFDDVAARELDPRLPIHTTPHATRKLHRQGFTSAVGMRTWDSHAVEKDGQTLTITSLPGRHGPTPLDRVLPEVMGSMLEFWAAGARPYRIYITGDTLIFDRLHEIPQRFPDIDLALLHLGGTRVLGVTLTMDADQGVQLLQLVAPAVAVPIHVDDYTVFRSPLEDFRRAVAAAELPTTVTYLDRGATIPIG